MNYTPDQRAILAAARQIKRASNKAVREKAKAARPKLKRERSRERDPAYLAWLRRQPCRIGKGCEGAVQAAHLRYGDTAHGRVNPGLQVKPSDRWATPLCAHHHREQHAAGNERRWWQSYGLDGSLVAIECFARFQGSQA